MLQCIQLCVIPYNQWIKDTTDNLQNITINYYNMLKPLLETSTADKKIYPLMNLCGAVNINFIPIKRNYIKPLGNFGKSGYSSIFDNLIRSEKATRIKFEELNPATTPIFPVRNGLLIWDMDGNYHLSTDNYKIYFPVQLNLIYDPDFINKHDEEYKIIEDAINKIFPIEEEKEYILKCMSSVLNGVIRKDTLFIQYGTGSDGKSFFGNIIMSMLGETSFRGTSEYYELIKGKLRSIPSYTNTKGLGSSAKSSLLLDAQGKANETDEGGKVNLINSRYCCIQEPDMKTQGVINGSVVKDILSGSAVNVRGIYKESMTTQFNPIVVLQTNSHMSIDDSTDGAKRRVKYIRMRSKFATATTEETFSKLEFHFEADSNLEKKIVENPILKSALLAILLPYCSNLIKSGIKSISDIIMPESYKRETANFFSEASGGFGAFSEVFLTSNTERFIPFNKLLRICMSINEGGYHGKEQAYQDKFCQNCFITSPRGTEQNRKRTREQGRDLQRY